MRYSRDTQGSIGVILLIVLLVLGLLGSMGFGVWAYSERTNFKNNYDQLAAEAIDKALENQKAELEKQFDEKEKQPFETYTGPSELGSVVLTYPKTWELYVDTGNNGSSALNGYAHPGYVPSIDGDTFFALRFRIVEQGYTQVMNNLSNNVRRGAVSVSPFRADKVPSVLGSKVVGEIESKKTGTKVILPLRDKTLEIWTEGQSFVGDFNTLLSTLTFVP